MKLDSKTSILDLKKKLYKFSKKRNWQSNYYPSHLSKSISIEAGELLECFQWQDAKKSELLSKDSKQKEKIAMEAVDVLYYLFMLFYVLEIDISESVERKLEELHIRYPENKKSD